MLKNDYTLSQELGFVVLKLLLDPLFIIFLTSRIESLIPSLKKEIYSFIQKQDEICKKKILFHIFDSPQLWADIIYDYSIKHNCKAKIDNMFTKTQIKNINHFTSAVTLDSGLLVELCCPSTQK